MVTLVDDGDALFVTPDGDCTWQKIAASVCALRNHLTGKGHPDPTGFELHDLISWARPPNKPTLRGLRANSVGT